MRLFCIITISFGIKSSRYLHSFFDYLHAFSEKLNINNYKYRISSTEYLLYFYTLITKISDV